jgi:hypothetical protein
VYQFTCAEQGIKQQKGSQVTPELRVASQELVAYYASVVLNLDEKNHVDKEPK